MKKFKGFFSILILLLALAGCGEESTDQSGQSTLGGGASQGENISFNFSLSSVLLYETGQQQNENGQEKLLTTNEEILQGEITITNTSDFSDVRNYDFTAILNENNFTLTSTRTLVLPLSEFQFDVVLRKGENYQYAGSTIYHVNDETNDVPLVIKPVIGETLTSVRIIESLAGLFGLRFQYPPNELETFTSPQLGISIDGGNELVFAINPDTGLTEGYVNTSEGDHHIRLRFYDGSTQRGLSIPEQENVKISSGRNIVMDLISLKGTNIFSLDKEGGSAEFKFEIPSEVVEEVGGNPKDLEVKFSVVGPKNSLQEKILILKEGGRNYTAKVILKDYHYDTVAYTLTFTDLGQGNSKKIGECAQEEVIVKEANQNFICDLNLRRSKIVGGHLLSTLSVNVTDVYGQAVGGAKVYANGKLLGITDGRNLGIHGNLLSYLIAGDYQIQVVDPIQNTSAEIAVKLLPLQSKNLQVELGVPNVDLERGLVAYYPFNGNANDESGNGNHGWAYGPTLTKDRFGKKYSAYSFDGWNDWIEAYSTDFEGEEITTSIWMYNDNHHVRGVLIEKIDHIGWNGSNYGTSVEGHHVYAWTEDKRDDEDYYARERLSHRKGWIQIVEVLTTESIKIYVDGVLEDTTLLPRGFSPYRGWAPLQIGGAPRSNYPKKERWYFNSSLDDVRIYNRALSDLEVQYLYQFEN